VAPCQPTPPSLLLHLKHNSCTFHLPTYPTIVATFSPPTTPYNTRQVSVVMGQPRAAGNPIRVKWTLGATHLFAEPINVSTLAYTALVYVMKSLWGLMIVCVSPFC
jgi:hypothetical protein